MGAGEWEGTQTTTEGTTGESGSALWKPAGGLPPLAMCMEEAEFNQTMVQEKRKVSIVVEPVCVVLLLL